MFTGSLVALITPFKNGSVDEKGFEKFVAWQIKEGTDGLVPCGTTGESPTLSMEEHKRVIDICIAAAKGTGVPVIAGTGSNSTAEAIDLTQHAKKAGADAAMLVVPYYNKPTQEGLFQHFKAVAEAVDIPILLYNVPPRTGGDMQVETVMRLSQVKNIIGIKDASYDMARPTLTKLKAKKGFIQLSGEDASAVGFLAQGGDGCISVTANVAPRLCGDMHDAWKKRDLDKVFEIQDRLMPLHKAMFCETSPGPVKYGAELIGQCERRDAPADGADHREQQEGRARGDGPCGPDQLGSSSQKRVIPSEARDLSRCRSKVLAALGMTPVAGRIDVDTRRLQLAKKPDLDRTVVAQNRKARHNYFIEETFEAGLALTGTEVKSLRGGRSTIAESYVTEEGGEAWLVNANIPNTPRATASITSRAGRASCCCTASRSTS